MATRRKIDRDPLEYMLSVMADPEMTPELRLKAAICACQYMHTRTRDGGKKEAQAEAASEASAKGKFAPAGPPKLVANNG